MADDVSPVVPFLHYADLAVAAEWLPRVFGLTVRSIEQDAAGVPSMAVFQHGTGLIFARQVTSAAGLTGGRSPARPGSSRLSRPAADPSACLRRPRPCPSSYWP